MSGGIELDDLGGHEFDNVEIVEVTGRVYRDRRRKSMYGPCGCKPSLRMNTILIFIGVGLVYIIGVAIGIILMMDSLEHLDTESSNTSINRLAMIMESDIAKIQEHTLSKWGVKEYYTAVALRNYSQILKDGPKIDEETGEPDEQKWKEQLDYALNQLSTKFFIKVANHENDGDFNCPMGVNYYAILDPQLNTLVDLFYPGDSKALCGNNTRASPPIIKPQTYKDMMSLDPDSSGWLTLIVPDGGDKRPLILNLEEFRVYSEDMHNGDYDPTLYGYMVFGRNILPRLNNGDNIADDVPTCITMEDGENDADKWDEEDNKMFAKVKAGSITPEKSYGGVPQFAQRSNVTISSTRGRVCPAVPLFQSTSTLMCGYMKLCGFDPEKFGEQHCIKIRVDRPMSMVEEGTTPVIILSLEVIAMMVALCIIFVVFLDCVVLRRVEALSNVIRSQTRGHQKAQEEEDEKSVGVNTAEEKHNENEKHGKSGKSSKGSSGASVSGTSETSISSATSAASNASATSKAATASANDEIGNLKRAMEQNAIGLRKRLEAVNDSIKSEQQKVVHHRQAMQLLNLWCGRKDFFPGLRPNAMQLRYEPTRNLDDIINNPIAIEYLKSHCDGERTLENIWFLLDVSWLEELENAEDNEEDAVKRRQIHDIAVAAAKSILKRYVVLNAPQLINVSAGTFEKLREKGEEYTRKMFDEAVSEIKLNLNTDILPRFQKTNAYAAMSETLYIDTSHGTGTDSSEFSDETVSTAGSILTDSASEGGEPNVGRLFAQTFKNLHTTLNVGDSSSRSNSIVGGPVGSVVPDSQTETTTNRGADDGDKDDEDDSSDLSEKEPPKLAEEEKKDKEEEKPKKDEKVESSESSSQSQSSDSTSSSSASGDASE